uniref:hypothetical protein n=1 Tax=Metallosphaera hakonensis TaxID=79601 RepID=UPI002092613E
MEDAIQEVMKERDQSSRRGRAERGTTATAITTVQRVGHELEPASSKGREGPVQVVDTPRRVEEV